MRYGNRIGEKEFDRAPYWADGIADYLIQKYPRKKKFVCAAGITPSGAIHFGNFREIATTYPVVHALINKGKKAELLFSWDTFDRFRKVPIGLDSSYEEHVGKAVSAIPSPDNPDISYAETYQREFESTMQLFNIPITFKDQTELYTAGAYDAHIITAMQKREEIADIMLNHMTDKGKGLKGISDAAYRSSYYPISLYSRFTGKDATEILSYDGQSTVRYRCKITNKEEEIDFTQTHIVKLGWKVDWAMRWMYEDVCFEPAGSDHLAPDGSYNTAAEIVKRIFGIDSPVTTEFGFVGIRGLGSKMSGSSGQTVTPRTLLDIYEPTLLMWMYLRRYPKQTFSLAFDTEVYRQYDELDAAMRASKQNIFRRLFTKDTQDPVEKRVLQILRKQYPDRIYRNPIPFRQLVGIGQVVQWDEQKLKTLLRKLKQSYTPHSIHHRLSKAKTWVTTYAPDAKITLRTKPNTEVWNAMDETNKQYLQQVCSYIQQNGTDNLQRLETFIYDLPKEHHTEEKVLKNAQRTLFKYMYQLLIDKKAGPRISTFLWSLPKEKVTLLLMRSQ